MGGCHPGAVVQACRKLLLGCCDTAGSCCKEGLLGAGSCRYAASLPQTVADPAFCFV